MKTGWDIIYNQTYTLPNAIASNIVPQRVRLFYRYIHIHNLLPAKYLAMFY